MPNGFIVMSLRADPYAVMNTARGPRSSLAFRGRGAEVLFRLLNVRRGKGAHEMAVPSRKRHLSGEARRALELLLDPNGTSEALMLAHGFTERMLGRLVRAGLITIRRELIKADGKTFDVGRVQITNAGRQELESFAARRPSPRLP